MIFQGEEVVGVERFGGRHVDGWILIRLFWGSGGRRRGARNSNKDLRVPDYWASKFFRKVHLQMKGELFEKTVADLFYLDVFMISILGMMSDSGTAKPCRKRLPNKRSWQQEDWGERAAGV